LSNILKGGAKEIKVYRLVGPAGAKSTRVLVDTTGAPVNVLTVDGKYKGARANSFTITVAANAINASRKDITLIESGTTLKIWTTRLDNAATGLMADIVDQINNDSSNSWITLTLIATGNETLANLVATAMASGVDDEGNIVGADYDEAMDAFENESANILYFDTIDDTIRTAIATWIGVERTAGRRKMWVTGSDTADAVSAAKTDAELRDSEGIIHVHPGFKRLNVAAVETAYGGYQAAARVAGMLAGLALNESLTFQKVDDIIDLETRLSNADIQSLFSSGVMPLVYDGSSFRVEKGINTLTSLASTATLKQDVSNKKVRVIRILDNVNNSLATAVGDNVIGKIANNTEGQDSVLSIMRTFLSGLVQDGLINSGFTLETDEDNDPADDMYFVKVGIQPIDAIEYMYLTVEVS
jgi:hypothetical protein